MTALTTRDADAIVGAHANAVTYIALPGTWTLLGWIAPDDDDFTFDDWQAIGPKFEQMRAVIRICQGDWLNYGEHRWGEKYAQAMDETGYAYGSLANAAWVARQVPISLRSEKTTFSHWQTVAPLKTLDKRREWLEQAEVKGWSVSKLTDEIKKSNSHTSQTIIIQCTLCGGTGELEKVI